MEYASGKKLYESLVSLSTKTKQVLNDSKAIIEPMLTAQEKTLTEGTDFTSLITDINQLTPIEGYINTGALVDMTYNESGLFTNTILPSNVVMVNDTRSIFIEEGLLYIVDFNADTLRITNREIHKIDPLWEICKTESQIRLDKGTNCVWVIPTHTDKIIQLSGNGVFGTGDIRYTEVPLPQEITVVDFKEWDGDIGILSSENLYYRSNAVMPIYGMSSDIWMWFNPLFKMTAICDGNIDYVASSRGEIYKLNVSTSKFTYVVDIKNQLDYEDHYMDWIKNPDDYHPIIALANNNTRWTILEKDNPRMFSCDTNAVGEAPTSFTEFEIPYGINSGTFICNRKGPYDRSIVYGFDSDLNAVAFSFNDETIAVDEVDLGTDVIPQYATFDISVDRAVMIGMYETTLLASDYYTEEEIAENGYMDFAYSSLVMRVATYNDYQYTFGPEFNPIFIPADIINTGDQTIITGKCGSSPLYNIAITKDQIHWDIINISTDIAINVQDIAFGNGTYIMVGLNSTNVLLSNDGYNWRSLDLDAAQSFMSVVYNDYHKKFYAINYEADRLYEIDTEEDSVRYCTLTFDSTASNVEAMSICNYHHEIIVTAKVFYSDGTSKIKSAITNTYEEETEMPDIIPMETYEPILFDPTTYGSQPASILKNSFEINGELFTLHQLDLPWDDEATTSYDQSLKTGVVVLHSRGNRRPESAMYGDETMFCSFFPMDTTLPVSMLLYLNHVVIIHPLYSKFITDASRKIPVAYSNTNTGKYFSVVVNGKSGCISDGHLHLIEYLSSRFTNLSYVMSSTQSYSPMINEADVVDGKKPYIINEYEPNNEPAEVVDKNGNIEIYPVTLSTLNDSYGPIIHDGDKYIKLPSQYNRGYISTNGADWTLFTMPSYGWWRDIAYNGSVYVAIKYTNITSAEIHYSTDLKTWKLATKPTASYGWASIIYTGERFIITAAAEAGCPCILTSWDGITWSMTEFTSNVDKIHLVHNSTDVIVVSSTVTTTSRALCRIIKTDNTVTEVTLKDETGTAIRDLCDVTAQYDTDGNLYFPAVLRTGGVLSKASSDGVLTRVETVGTRCTALRDLYDEHDNLIILAYPQTNTTEIYIDYFQGKADSYNAVKIAFPSSTNYESNHLICYNQNKLIIGLSRPAIVNLIDTFPDVMEGSFFIGSGKYHNQSLPFTPDHVYLFNGNSSNQTSKFLLGEMHLEEVLTIDGSKYKSIIFFDNSADSINYRADVSNEITENGFLFVNNTSNDRHINFIAIKENHYQ